MRDDGEAIGSAADRAPYLAIATAPPESGHALVLLLQGEETRLHPRTAGDSIHPPHPGTAVRHDDQLFEVVSVNAGEPPYRFRYGLVPIDERTTVRTVLDLSPAGIERYVSARRKDLSERRRLAVHTLLVPFVGLLPRRRIVALERDIGLSAARTAEVSAFCSMLLTLPLAAFCIVMTLADGLGMIYGAAVLTPSPAVTIIAGYLAVESLVRVRYRDPLGSLPVAVVVKLLEEIGVLRGVRDPEEERAARQRAVVAAAGLADRVQLVPAPGGEKAEMTIESAAPKSWPDGAFILYDRRPWSLLSRSEQVRHGRVVYVARLLEMDAAAIGYRLIEYHPEAERRSKQERDRRDFAERLGVFLPLAGFLPGDQQLRWQSGYGFDARRATRVSAWIEVVLGGLSLMMALANASRFPAHARWEQGIALGAALFLLEGVIRLRRLSRDGRPSGTIVLAWVGSEHRSRGGGP